MAKNKYVSVFLNGIVHENPTFRLVLGMCPTLAVTTAGQNGVGMGLAATFVLVGSNVVISLLRKFIPDKVRIPAFIVVIAAFTTMVQLLMQAFLPALYDALGLFIPLIVVNCIILARAESFASKNTVAASAVDGICQGIGYTIVLLIMCAFRELFGNGTLAGIQILPESYTPALLLVLPVGGFLCLGVLIAVMQWALAKSAAKKEGK